MHQPQAFWNHRESQGEKKNEKNRFEQSSDSMVDKQSNTLLINSVMRWMSFSVLSNKEILSGVNVISLKTPVQHIEALESCFYKYMNSGCGS